MARLSPLLLALPLLAACGNPCQQLCTELADYAASECGMTVSPDEVASCKEAFSGANLAEGQAQVCADSNDPEYIREWWTCEDLAENFTNGTK